MLSAWHFFLIYYSFVNLLRIFLYPCVCLNNSLGEFYTCMCTCTTKFVVLPFHKMIMVMSTSFLTKERPTKVRGMKEVRVL